MLPSRPSEPGDVRLSVVIPAHQAAGVLPAQLDALLRQDPGAGWEIVVVDNGSTDGTAALAERYAAVHPRVRLVTADAASNASYARNAGARAARGDWLAFLDADDVVAPGWVAAMEAASAVHEFVVGPLEYDRLNPQWAVDVRGTSQSEDFFYVDGGPPWPVAFAANLGIARARHEQIGGFDETLPWGGEDADYTWRLHAAGVTPTWVPDAVVHYRLRTQLRPMYAQAVGYARSRWQLHQRYADVWPVPPTAPSRVQLVKRCVLLLRRLRSRAGLGWWVWQLGWGVGDREGASRFGQVGGVDGSVRPLRGGTGRPAEGSGEDVPRRGSTPRGLD